MLNPERNESSLIESPEYNYDIQNDGDLIVVTGPEDPEQLAAVAANICEKLGYRLLPADELALCEGDAVGFGKYNIEIRDGQIKVLLNEADDESERVEMEEAVEEAIS